MSKIPWVGDDGFVATPKSLGDCLEAGHISASGFTLFHVVASSSNGASAFVTLDRLATKMRSSVRSVQRALAELEGIGAVTIARTNRGLDVLIGVAPYGPRSAKNDASDVRSAPLDTTPDRPKTTHQMSDQEPDTTPDRRLIGHQSGAGVALDRPNSASAPIYKNLDLKNQEPRSQDHDQDQGPIERKKRAPRPKGERRTVNVDEWLDLPATRKDRPYAEMPWRAYFEIRYPWFDGCNGRSTVADTAAACFAYYAEKRGGMIDVEATLDRWLRNDTMKFDISRKYRADPGYRENDGTRAHMRIMRAKREKDYAGSASWPAWVRSACGLSPEVGPKEKSNSEPLATPQGQQLPVAPIESKAPIAPNVDTGEVFDFQAIIEKAMKKSRETAAAAFKHAGMDP